MIRRICILSGALFCISFSVIAYATNLNNGDFSTSSRIVKGTPLANTIWIFNEFDYDSHPGNNAANWHKGEIVFNQDYTLDSRVIDSSGNFDPTNIEHLKYSLDNKGSITITSENPEKIYPFISGREL